MVDASPSPAPTITVPSYRDAAFGARSTRILDNFEPQSFDGAAPSLSKDPKPLNPKCSDKNCSDGLVAIESVMIDPTTYSEEKGQCNGFLITPNIVVTARHCVPADIQAMGENCKGRMWFFFPETKDAKSEQRDCDHIDYLSPNIQVAVKTPDYVFLQLAQPIQHHHPVTIERTGLQDGQTVEIYHHEAESNPEKWHLDKIQCKVAQNTYYSPDFNRALDTRITLTDCPIIPGDSGSAVFSTDGAAVGIVDSISLITPASSELTAAYKLGLAPENLSPTAFGTSFACIPDPTDTRSVLPADCEHFLNGKGQVELNAAEQAAANALVAQWQAQNKNMQWALFRPADEALQGLLAPVPSCVSKDQLNSWAQGHGIIQLKLPIWSLKYDASLKLTPATQMIEDLTVEAMTNVEDLSNQGKATMSIIGSPADPSDALSGMFFIYNGEISICKTK